MRTRVEEDFQMKTLIARAEHTYASHFSPIATFERAIFFSWGCSIGDCGFCYMSTQPEGKRPTDTKRGLPSLFAELILAKNLEWDIGFFTGGIGVYTPRELREILKVAHEITGEKLWLSVGPISRPFLEDYLPYIKGVVGSTETINPEVHRKVCPSKPLAPYERMFRDAKELGLLRAMTFIVGMGETYDDFALLKRFIEDYDINKVHVYGLIPQKGTMFEHTPPPTKEQQVWWIANTRVAFPSLDIQAGIWTDRVEWVGDLLRAGANSISKFPATKCFGLTSAKELERQVALSRRTFRSNLTVLPDVNWDAEVEALSIDHQMKEKIKEKIEKEYLRKMKKNVEGTILWARAVS